MLHILLISDLFIVCFLLWIHCKMAFLERFTSFTWNCYFDRSVAFTTSRNSHHAQSYLITPHGCQNHRHISWRPTCKSIQSIQRQGFQKDVRVDQNCLEYFNQILDYHKINVNHRSVDIPVIESVNLLFRSWWLVRQRLTQISLIIWIPTNFMNSPFF